MNRPLTLLLPLACALVALLGMVAVVAPPRTVAANDRPTVILIMVDALRPDHVSSYGYDRLTTPNLDQLLVAQGTQFMDASSASSWTYPGNAALLTGRMPSDIGVQWNRDDTRIPESETMLAEHLKAAGYTTAGFVNAYYVWPNFGFGDGYDWYEVVQSGQNADAAKVNLAAFEWLDNTWEPTLQDKPLFLYLYYYDPHTIYDPPPPYDLLYDSTYTGTLTGEVYNNGEKVVSGEIVPTARDIEHLKALYDGEITYWDDQFAAMMARLDELGLLDDAIVIISADHGQMFGEHDMWTHHNSLYEEAIRVPLVINWPGVLPPSQTISAPVTTMDVTPTLLDLLGLPLPNNLSGKSLAPLLMGGAPELLRPIYSELSGETDPTNHHYWNSPRHEQRAVKQAGWKYIHEIRYYDDEGDALYEVQPASQYEVTNTLGTDAERTATLHEMLFNWFTIPTQFNFLSSVQGGAETTTRIQR